MSTVDVIYRSAPAALQDLAVSAYGWRSRARRYGDAFRSELRILAQSERWSADRLFALQTERLRSLLAFALEAVPHYRQYGLATGRGADPWDGLSTLPFLTKADVRDLGPQLHSAVASAADTVWNTTSGTTGTPLRIPVDGLGRQRNFAYVQRLMLRAGCSIHEPGAILGGRVLGRDSQMMRRPWRNDLLGGHVYLSSYHLSEATIGRYAARLRRLSPAWIEAYPSAAWVLGRLALEAEEPLPRPRLVLLSAETVHPEARALVELAFDAPTVDFYGAAEQAAFIAQCGHGRYHPHPEFGVVELLPVGETEEGEPMHEIIATGFHNHAMPLLRYRTGDMVRGYSEACECGATTPAFSGIVGRQYDLIITPEGRRIAGIGPVFTGLPARETQLIQVARDRVRLLIVAQAPHWQPEHERAVLEALRRRLGRGMAIDVQYVDAIPVGANGKRRLTVNLVFDEAVARAPAPALARGA